MSSERARKTKQIGASVMASGEDAAEANRRFFREHRLLTINLISSPGAGKTTLLERMAETLGPDMAVIAGDLQTRRDAERIQKAGSAARQIETGGACHLDARQVAVAAVEMGLPEQRCRVLVIENVGNLVCPSSFDLGEHMKVALLSLPEGDDKVLKYPSIFSRIGALLINKIDLAAHMDFDVDRAVRECASLNDGFDVFRLSAKTGEGVDAFCRYLLEKQSALTA